MGTVHVGTSGFVYRHWRGPFYPERLPVKHWLPYYAERFDTLELNATFYRLPSVEAAVGWREGVPRGFLYACKGSRFLTHMKRLLETGEGLKRFFTPIRRLGGKLGPVLWQLPPQMVRPDLPRLEGFLRRLPRQVRHAFEFRQATWYSEEVCDLLDRYGAAFCEHDFVRQKPPRFTGGFRYLRFHGADGRYTGRYGTQLRALAKELDRWRTNGGDAFVYFNNDLGCHAPQDALELKGLLDSR